METELRNEILLEGKGVGELFGEEGVEDEAFGGWGRRGGGEEVSDEGGRGGTFLVHPPCRGLQTCVYIPYIFFSPFPKGASQYYTLNFKQS